MAAFFKHISVEKKRRAILKAMHLRKIELKKSSYRSTAEQGMSNAYISASFSKQTPSNSMLSIRNQMFEKNKDKTAVSQLVVLTMDVETCLEHVMPLLLVEGWLINF